MRHYISQFILLLVLGVIIFFTFYDLTPRQPFTQLAESGFSMDKAFKDVQKLSRKPHSIGTAAHSNVRNYITNQLQEIGLQVQTQKGYDLNATRVLTVPENIITKIQGTDPQPGSDLLILSHYDSAVHSSYGASDDAAGVATILESLRTLLRKDFRPKNNIIICFTDAEEVGLNGADFFVKDHPWAENIGLVVNFEARGSGGPSNTIIETNQGNQALVKAFQKAKPSSPVANSLMYSVYKILPNDTDATVFREEKDIPSFFFAFIDDHYDYHTAQDIASRLNKNSLAHQASYLMAMLPYFGSLDLNTLKSSQDSVYFNIPGGQIINYSYSWILPLLIFSWLLFLGLMIWGFRSKRLDLSTVGKGALAFMISLVLSALVCFFGWKFILIIYPAYTEIQQGFTPNGHWYIAAFVCVSLSILFFMYDRFYKAENAPGLFTFPLFFWLLLNTGIALFFKGATYFIIPILFGLLSYGIMLWKHRPHVLFLLFLAIPAICLFSPLIQFFPVGLGLKMLVISGIFVVLLFALLLPVFGYFRRKRQLSVLVLFMGIIFLLFAHNKSAFSKNYPKPNSLVYELDVDKQKATWNTYDAILDDWTKDVITEKKSAPKNQVVFDNKYQKTFRYSQVAPLEAVPAADLLMDHSIEDSTILYSLKIVPKRNINRIELFSVEAQDLQNLRFNGIKAEKYEGALSKSHKSGEETKNKVLTYYAIDRDTLRVEFSLKQDKQVNLDVYEISNDLLDNPWVDVEQRTSKMMPKPFVVNDALITKQSLFF